MRQAGASLGFAEQKEATVTNLSGAGRGYLKEMLGRLSAQWALADHCPEYAVPRAPSCWSVLPSPIKGTGNKSVTEGTKRSDREGPGISLVIRKGPHAEI